jgi:O-antigen/teichoic acid export membrane protein
LAGTIHDHNKSTAGANSVWIWAGEAFWVGFGLITSVLALFAGTRFLTRLMSTDEYGKLALAISLSTLAVLIFGDPIGKTAVRFYSLWCRAGKPYGFMQTLVKSLVRAMGGIGLCCIIIIISGYYITAVPGSYFVLVTGFFAIALVFNRVAMGLEDAARKRRFRGILQGSFEIMRFVFAIGFIIIFALPVAETVLSGFVLAGILAVTAHGIFLYLLFRTDPAEKKGHAHTGFQMDVSRMDNACMRSFQSPLIISSACIWLVMMAERWVLKYYGGPGDVGGYAAVYQLAFIPMLLVSNFLILLIEPVLYQVVELDGKTASAEQTQRINNYAVFGILSFSFLLFLGLLFSYPMVGSLLLGVEFRSYSWMFPWLLLAGGCFAAARQLLLKLSYDMRTDLLAAIWAGVAVVAVAAYVTGALYWQLKGILVAIVAVNMALVVFSLVFVNKGRVSAMIKKHIQGGEK